MKNNNILLGIILTVMSLTNVGCAGQTAQAQTVPETPTSTDETSGSETETSDEEDLAPLEVVTLPEPTLATGENGERQTHLSVGEPAPWAGVLFSPEAVAFILAEYQALQLRASAALVRQRESDWLRLQLEVGRLRLQIDADRDSYRIELEGRDREILRLEEAHQALINEHSNDFWDDFLMVGGGILGGTVVGILIGLLAGL